MLSQTYEAEQKQLEADTARLRQEIEVQEAENDHLERFIEKARAYVGIKKLDGYICFIHLIDTRRYYYYLGGNVLPPGEEIHFLPLTDIVLSRLLCGSVFRAVTFSGLPDLVIEDIVSEDLRLIPGPQKPIWSI